MKSNKTSKRDVKRPLADKKDIESQSGKYLKKDKSSKRRLSIYDEFDEDDDFVGYPDDDEDDDYYDDEDDDYDNRGL